MDMVKDWTNDQTSISSALPPPTPPVLLGSHLWFDPLNRTLWRKRKHILLTPREAQILILLLQAPGRYLTASLLADWLSTSKGKPVYEHSIEQTISGLRRKLGESGKPHLYCRQAHHLRGRSHSRHTGNQAQHRQPWHLRMKFTAISMIGGARAA